MFQPDDRAAQRRGRVLLAGTLVAAIAGACAQACMLWQAQAAGAVVADGYGGRPRVAADGDGDAPAGRRVLGGVVQEVAEHLHEPAEVEGSEGPEGAGP